MGAVAGVGGGKLGLCLFDKGEAWTARPEGGPRQPSLLSWLLHIEELGTWAQGHGKPGGAVGQSLHTPALTLIHTSVTSSYTTYGWTSLGTALAKAARCSSLSVEGMNRAGGRRTSWRCCWGRSRNMAQALEGEMGGREAQGPVQASWGQTPPARPCA